MAAAPYRATADVPNRVPRGVSVRQHLTRQVEHRRGLALEVAKHTRKGKKAFRVFGGMSISCGGSLGISEPLPNPSDGCIGLRSLCRQPDVSYHLDMRRACSRIVERDLAPVPCLTC